MFIQSLKISLVVVLVFSISGGCGRSIDGKMDAYMTMAHDVWQFNGSVLVGLGDQIVFSGGYGLSDIEAGKVNQPSTKFSLGSLTKQFTAAAIMHLEQKGLLSLDDPVTRYLPDFPEETGSKITIHHLLSHTSGIPSANPDMMKLILAGKSVLPGELIATFADLPLEFEPGEKYSYSNSGYILLGAIIEKLSGQTYAQYLDENFFKPLGMDNTGVFDDYTAVPGFAVGYQPGPDKRLVPSPVVHPSAGFSAGAVGSTVEDLFKWSRALYSDRILTTASVDKMFTANLGEYGYGWVVRNIMGHKIVCHGGGSPGFITWIERWIDDSIFIAVLCNNVGSPDGTIAADLGRILRGEAYEPPRVKKPVPINPELLDDYVGLYEIERGSFREITRSGDNLLARRDSGTQLKLVPEGNDRFYFEHKPTITMEFVRGDDGAVVEHVIRYWINEESAKKVEN